MHLTVTRALLAQIRQPNIGTVTRNQILLSILPAFLAQKSRTLPLDARNTSSNACDNGPVNYRSRLDGLARSLAMPFASVRFAFARQALSP